MVIVGAWKTVMHSHGLCAIGNKVAVGNSANGLYFGLESGFILPFYWELEWVEIEDKSLICLMKGRYASKCKISDNESKNNKTAVTVERD